ncbi:MAG: sigma-70 family RNA polymerase sigma factor, partial [Burkholderiales bacterium]|nr:sigma-70 family RNA polymerase sigma factor [Burkholderiales bacterium]
MLDVAQSEANITSTLASARAGNRDAFSALAEPHRLELQAHCYRMLGSAQDAEDLVQETLLRAWRRLDTYAGRAPFRAWLYKIATNACLDVLDRRPKRTLPVAKVEASDPGEPLAPPISEPIWLEPYPDELLAASDSNPEARYDARESISLAFLTALQVLPPRQRAIVILRDVLDWRAREVAESLDTTVSAVNSALHRARTTLAKHYQTRDVEGIKSAPADDALSTLLDRYVRAWERAEIDTLISLLTEEVTFPMPPSPSWYQGRPAVRAFISANILDGDARGRWRLLPTRANGRPAFAWYKRDPSRAVYNAFAIQVLTVDGNLIADITTFA